MPRSKPSLACRQASHLCLKNGPTSGRPVPHQTLSMSTELFPLPIHVNPVTIAGISLWATTFYLGLFPWSEWLTKRLSNWFNVAERLLYFSEAEFEKNQSARESQNAFWASIFSIVPFLGIGALSYFGLIVSLGASWALSAGIIACIGSGVYELGRRDGQASRK